MSRVKIDLEVMGLTSLFSRISRAKVLDCLSDDDTLYFVVARGEMGKALGKGAINVKKFEKKCGKKVRVVEHNDDVTRFVANLIYPLRVASIELVDGAVVLKDDNRKTKGQIFGRDGKNLERIKRAVGRFFAGVDVRVE